MNVAKRWLPILTVLLAIGDQTALAQSEAAKGQDQEPAAEGLSEGTLEFVVVYPAGGGMDVTTRILAKYVEKWTRPQDHRDQQGRRRRHGGPYLPGHAGS